MSRVSITTKTCDDDVSMTYDLTQDGAVTDKKPSHLGQGRTSISVTPTLCISSLATQEKCLLHNIVIVYLRKIRNYVLKIQGNLITKVGIKNGRIDMIYM